jgi:2-keto-4-pentenoate hydratase/2-oxohepta-3-ene-1,7-dioic acid hydratase in catechol pathway
MLRITRGYADVEMDKIICVGKNYLEHAQELGDAVPEKPVLFLKPPSVLSQPPHPGTPLEIPLPRGKGEVHYETEIVLRLKDGKPEAAAIGLDLTLRTLQAQLKKAGHPWTLGKVFPHAAVVGPWVQLSQFPNYLEEPFQLLVNGQVRQSGLGKDMRMGPVSLIQYISEWFPVCEGDLLFTGTPAGVGEVRPGDRLQITWGSQYSYWVSTT